MAPNTPNLPAATPIPPGPDAKYDEGILLHRLASLHALHGPPGAPSPHAAHATSWPTSPFASPRTVPFHVPLSERDLTVLAHGFVPEFPGCPWQDGEVWGEGLWEPKHKWFIFSELEGDRGRGGERGGEGDGERAVWRVHMYRSWTAVKLVELRIEAGLLGATREGYSKAQDGVLGPKDRMKAGIKVEEQEEQDGPRMTHITFETHEDYKLKGADAALYKYVAREVCWWVMRVCLGSELAG